MQIKRLFLFWVTLLSLLPFAGKAEVRTWTFVWDKSFSDPTAEGFYNFGSSFVDQDFYTTQLNGLAWNIQSEGTKKYSYMANSGQAIGTPGEPSAHTTLWTTAFSGKIVAVRVQARTNKAENAADLTVKVNNVSYLTSGTTAAALTNTLGDYAFAPDGDGLEGELKIEFVPTSDVKSTLYIKKIEVDYEEVASSVPSPVFAPAAGTYDEPVDVTISVPDDEGATVYYTTDGSNPRVESESRQMYSAPVRIAQTTKFMACAKLGDEYSDVAAANYVIRKPAGIYFNNEQITLTSGNDGYADLVNPNKVEPITYTSSAPLVCSVDQYGTLYSSYVETTQTVGITASFAGNDEYLPHTATCQVTVVARTPLKTPVVSPMGGTFDAPVEVTISTDDENAVTIWYSTTAKDADEFVDDYEKSVITEASEVKLTIDKTCRLYVMTRGYNVNSSVVTADFVVNEPVQAGFTTDRAYTSYYIQNFDSKEELAGWTVGKGWTLVNKDFSAIDANDKYSISIGYNDGDGTSSLISPAIDVRENSVLQFYAYFQAIFLYYGRWQLNAVDTKTGEGKTLFDAFSWAQDNAYTGPSWNKFELPLDAYAGKNVKFELVYPFGGENLAIDGFCLRAADAEAEESIHIFEGESISFVDKSTGSPDNILWTFEGGTPATSTIANPIVTYNEAGTYSVTLTVTKDGKESTVSRKDLVVVAQKAPTAIIGLPEEGYMSPYVGVFIPTNVPVTFRDLSTGNPTSWHWQFQNTVVEESKEQNPTVTYIKKSTTSVGLTVANNAGSSNDMLQYAIQAGGAQFVWNISPDENQNIEKVSLGWYGNYAGSNWLGMDRFAEHYQAPLADAVIDSVAVFFATATTVSPDAEITLSICSVSDNGQPGSELASTSLKASDLRYDDQNVVATIFKFSEPVNIGKGQEFFITVGPFPNATMEESPYTSDDIAIFCVRRGEGNKNTAWQYLEDQDDYGQGLGTYQWFENTDDPLSMAIAPVITYDKPGTDGIRTAISTEKIPVAYYNLSGQSISEPQSGIYIVRYSDGSSEKRIAGK